MLLVGGGVIGGLIAGGGEETRTLSAQTAPEGAKVDLKIGDEGATLVATGMPAPPRGPRLPGVDAQAGREAGPDDRAVDAAQPTDRPTCAVPGSLDGVQSVLVGRAARRLAGADDHPGHRRPTS